jgi:predicted phage gp36 major capsid-like protein
MRELGLDQAKDSSSSQPVQVQDYSNQLLDELRSRVESLEKQLGIKDGQINRLQDMNEKLNQVVENSQVLLRLTSEKQAPEMPGEKGFVTVVDNQPSQAQKTAENENNKVKEEKPWWKGLFN